MKKITWLKISFFVSFLQNTSLLCPPFSHFFALQKKETPVITIENYSAKIVTFSYQKHTDSFKQTILINPGETIKTPYPWPQKTGSKEIDIFELAREEQKKDSFITVLSPNASPIKRISITDPFFITIE